AVRQEETTEGQLGETRRRDGVDLLRLVEQPLVRDIVWEKVGNIVGKGGEGGGVCRGVSRELVGFWVALAENIRRTPHDATDGAGGTGAQDPADLLLHHPGVDVLGDVGARARVPGEGRGQRELDGGLALEVQVIARGGERREVAERVDELDLRAV